MRALATLVTSLAMALAAIGLAVAAPGRGNDPARASLQAAGGSVSISNSLAGAAVLAAADMRPGGSVDGTVTIGNDGDVAGRFALDVVDVADQPGPNGGALSGRVVLTVEDVTAGTTVFTGALTDFAESDLGTLAPGDEHDFRLTLAWPGGADDNLFQGSALSLGLSWRAGAAGGAAPTPAPPTKPRPKPTPTPKTPTTPTTPARPVSVADQVGLPKATRCVKRGKLRFRLKAPAGTKIVSATVSVNGRTKARLKGAKVRKAISLKKLKKKTKVKVTLKLAGGRKLTASRAYRACR